MIRIYQGVDLVEVSKLRRVIEKHHDFLNDLFTERERTYCLAQRDPFIHLAGRFAAKEACLKALGLGLSVGIDSTLQEIEIVPHSSGKPLLTSDGWVARIGKKRRIRQWSVSIAHSGHYAIATVLLLGELPRVLS